MLPRQQIVYLTYTICSHYHNASKVAYCVPYLHNMLPLSYFYPIIIILPRKHIVYPTYTICSHYHNASKVAYCVPYLHNMLPLSYFYPIIIIYFTAKETHIFNIHLIPKTLIKFPPKRHEQV